MPSHTSSPRSSHTPSLSNPGPSHTLSVSDPGPSKQDTPYPDSDSPCSPASAPSCSDTRTPSCSYTPKKDKPLGPSKITNQVSLEAISDALPGVPVPQLKFLLDLHSNDASIVTNLVLEGLTLPSVVKMLKVAYLDEYDVRRLVMDEYGDFDRLAEEAIAFYKGSKFSPHAEVRICIENQPAVDAGGVRRQFMCDVFSYFSTSSTIKLFEGPKNRLRPVFRQSSISSGLLTLVGKMVGHSVILDGQGFPFFSPACYLYMAGYLDRAISVISIADAGERVQAVILSVSCD